MFIAAALQAFVTAGQRVAAGLACALFAAQASADPPKMVTPACAKPAALLGNFEPKAPGYIVTLKLNGEAAAGDEAYRLRSQYGLKGFRFLGIIRGFSVAELSPDTLAALRCEPAVDHVSYSGLTGTAGDDRPRVAPPPAQPPRQ